jgi:hypothetical protein
VVGKYKQPKKNYLRANIKSPSTGVNYLLKKKTGN